MSKDALDRLAKEIAKMVLEDRIKISDKFIRTASVSQLDAFGSRRYFPITNPVALQPDIRFVEPHFLGYEQTFVLTKPGPKKPLPRRENPLWDLED